MPRGKTHLAAIAAICDTFRPRHTEHRWRLQWAQMMTGCNTTLRGRLKNWLEPQLMVLALVVLGIYFPRLGNLTLRGEETRRARVAIEMLETGDFVVPREQGRVFPDRPPLGNWLIAMSMFLSGNSGAVAVRLPTVLATLATTLLIYGYSRSFLSRNGA